MEYYSLGEWYFAIYNNVEELGRACLSESQKQEEIIVWPHHRNNIKNSEAGDGEMAQ